MTLYESDSPKHETIFRVQNIETEYLQFLNTATEYLEMKNNLLTGAHIKESREYPPGLCNSTQVYL